MDKSNDFDEKIINSSI